MISAVETFGTDRARSWKTAMGRGIKGRCPQCGRGRLFVGYIKTLPACSACSLDFSGHRADDAPPYLTIIIVGHLAIPLALAWKEAMDPPMWMQFSIWLPVVLIASWFTLPAAKGAMIALQWANRMHGFEDAETEMPRKQLDS